MDGDEERNVGGADAGGGWAVVQGGRAELIEIL